MNEISIEDKIIGKEHSCFFIAEAGVNHNGDIQIAKKLVDAAVDCKSDAIKFQTFKADLIVTKKAEKANYQKINNNDESQYSMLKKLELSENEFRELKKYCQDKEIIFLSTPHSDKWSVDVLEELGISAYKIGSGDLTNIPILNYISKKNKPMILGTGMSDMEEIIEAKKEIEKRGNERIIFLQCTTMYPTPNNKVNLNSMLTIKEKTKNIVGFSDHTLGLEASIISVCLGAKIVEKHFTLDKNMEGPDHKASMEPHELKSLIKSIRLINQNSITDPNIAFQKINDEYGYSLNEEAIKIILGRSEKTPEHEEIEIAKIARKSIITLSDISEGDILNENNIGIRRPGEGLKPKFFSQLLGKTSNKDIAKDSYVFKGDVE